jgi:phage shock protein A
MTNSDSEASTGEPPVRRQSQRTTQKPSRLIDDQERDASAVTQNAANKKHKPKSTDENTNKALDPQNLVSNTFAKLILEKLNAQASNIEKLHTQLLQREEKEKQYQTEIENLRSQVKDLSKTVDKIHAATSASYRPSSANKSPTSEAPSTGRSWASVLTSSSIISPETKAITTALALPHITINL